MPTATKAAAKPSPAAAAAKSKSLLDATDILRAMWYGDAGKGKTFDLAHMANLGKIIYIDAEKRLKKGPLVRAGVKIENIEPRFGNEDERLSYPTMLALSVEIQERLADGEVIVGTVWDSTTEIHRILVEDLVDQGVIKAERSGKDRDPWKTHLDDFGDMTEQMRRLIRRYRDLPIHLGMACLAKRDQDEEGGVRVSPAVTPAVARDFMGYMDVVIHKRMEVVGGDDEYSGLTRPIGRFEAKDSFGMLPRILVNPTFTRVLDYINGDLVREKDPIQIKAREARAAQAREEPGTETSTPASGDE